MFQAAALARVKSKRFRPSSSYTPGCAQINAPYLGVLLKPVTVMTGATRLAYHSLVYLELGVTLNSHRHADATCGTTCTACGIGYYRGRRVMQCAHSDLNLSVGATTIAEHPRPDNLNAEPVHLLHCLTEKAVLF
jgi:hypothetical protein